MSALRSQPQSPRQLNGIVILNKPGGLSSAQCLRPFKRQGQKKLGHAGTLDPMACGVLPVLLGQATKLATWLQKGGKKIYSGTIRLGLETDTWDIEGQLVAESKSIEATPAEICREIASWRELKTQPVPPFSAAKQQGKPLYKLARQGNPVTTKTRQVQVYEADALEINGPIVSFRVVCSSGTYIRSLAHSLGKRLGCGAALQSLLREYSQPFDLSAACSWAELESGAWTERVLPLVDACPDWPRVQLTSFQGQFVRHGRAVPAPPDAEGLAFLCEGEDVLAVAEADGNPREWVIKRGLWKL